MEGGGEGDLTSDRQTERGFYDIFLKKLLLFPLTLSQTKPKPPGRRMAKVSLSLRISRLE